MRDNSQYCMKQDRIAARSLSCDSILPLSPYKMDILKLLLIESSEPQLKHTSNSICIQCTKIIAVTSFSTTSEFTVTLINAYKCAHCENSTSKNWRLRFIRNHTRVPGSVSEGVELGPRCNNWFTRNTPINTPQFIGAEFSKTWIHPTKQQHQS